MRLITAARLALGLLGMCLAGELGAQSRDPAATPGRWRDMDRILGKPGSAEQNLVAQLDAVALLFRPLPSLNPPVGFTVAPRLALVGRDPATKMLQGTYLLFLVRHVKRKDGSVDISGAGEGLTISVEANNLECVMGQGNFAHFEDRDGSLYYAPVAGSFRGVVTYNGCVLLTRRSVLPFMAASRERVMKIVIEQLHELPSWRKHSRLDSMEWRPPNGRLRRGWT